MEIGYYLIKGERKMNTSYYADINSILTTFYVGEEEADKIFNTFEDYDYDELEEEEEENEEEDFFSDR